MDKQQNKKESLKFKINKEEKYQINGVDIDPAAYFKYMELKKRNSWLIVD